MRVEKWKHVRVNERGSVENGGGVGVKPDITVFWTGQSHGCDRDKPFIVMNFGREKTGEGEFDGEVSGVTLFFKNDVEMNSYLINRGALDMVEYRIP